MKKVFLIIFFLLSSFIVFAMKVRTIDISYNHILNLTYKIFVTTYIPASSSTDDSIQVSWGDGTSGFIARDSIINVSNNIRKCVYSGIHTFVAPDIYTVSFEFYSRNGGIINIPNSANIPVYVEAELIINPFLGYNNSPVLLNDPTYYACVDHTFVHNSGAYDVDGDSISYKLIHCKGENGSDIPGYIYPETSNTFSIDPVSGDLLWDSPVSVGKYDIAILFEEWRYGMKIGSVMRDMQIDVVPCQGNNMPLIDTLPDIICVEAGTTIQFDVTATSLSTDTLILTATGVPFILINNPAQFPQPTIGTGTVTSEFKWQTLCTHVREQSYQVIFKAENNYSDTNPYGYINNFNNGTLGTGWSSTNQAQLDNPCDPSEDGSIYLWMGNTSPASRIVTSTPFDVSQDGLDICFDMKYAEQGNQPCEGPDSTGEGVYLRYSINGINGPWNTIEYWDPTIPSPGGYNPGLINWNNYCLSIPPAAQTTNTIFSWVQVKSSGALYDHWGLDNIQIDKTPVNLIDNKTVKIIIIGPAPKNLTATPFGNNIILSWNKSICDNAVGYKIYRKDEYYGYVHGACETGVPAYTGYSQIATLNNINDTTYTDNNNGSGLIHGFSYCYMVIAYFSDGAESYASEEVCAALKKDIPVITNVSVNNTDAAIGSIYIAWSKPTELDTIQFPEPYKYFIYRSNDFNGSNFTLSDSLTGLNDTTFIDTLINTNDFPFSYKIELFNNTVSDKFLLGSTQIASSVFLSAYSTDNKLILSWEENVPWTNNQYIIFRQNPITSLFDSIAYTNTHSYSDSGLVNGNNYCYKIESIGNYTEDGIINPIINYSQIVCAVPVDNVPPCAPLLTIVPDCKKVENTLTWNNPNNTCAEDIAGYYIYFSSTEDNDFIPIYKIEDPTITSFIHAGINTIAGCYAVTSVDSALNLSDFSNVVCVDIDICDLYNLPNIFTPNGDGYNDYFIPFPYDFIEKIDLTIFSRWGNIVFKTNNPQINWDGKIQATKTDCSEGVYFYVCEVYEIQLSGHSKRILAGYIQLLR